MKNLSTNIGAIIIAAAIIVGAIVVGGAYTYKYRVQNTITVTGLAETEFTSDIVVWRGDVSTESADASRGYAKIEENKKKVLDFITSRGIDAGSVEFGFVNVNKNYESIYTADGNYAGQRFTGYSLNQPFTVESKDVETIEGIMRDISSLIAQGVQMDLWSPSYYFSGLDGLKLDVIERATLDARERAERIADKSGCRLGKVKNARIGVFQITGANTDEEFTAGGSFNTSSRLKKARITVRLEYLVK